MVSGTQEVFRLLLDALANPGRPVNLSSQVSKFASDGVWLAPALTLLDNETSFYWDGLPEIGEEIRFLSGAAQVPPEKADFVFITSSEINSESKAAQVLSQVNGGTYRDPHNSALIFIAAENTAGENIYADIKGPGIPPEGRSLALSKTEAMWIRARDAQGFEYPRGVELVIMRQDNSIFAITRKAAVTWRT